jgi:hypothetical protein
MRARMSRNAPLPPITVRRAPPQAARQSAFLEQYLARSGQHALLTCGQATAGTASARSRATSITWARSPEASLPRFALYRRDQLPSSPSLLSTVAHHSRSRDSRNASREHPHAQDDSRASRTRPLRPRRRRPCHGGPGLSMAYRIFQEAGAAEAAAVADNAIREPWRRDGTPGPMVILHAQSARWRCSSQLALWGGFACFSGC